MADSSFDVVSKIDRMELDNAINQAIREIDTRFDFKNTGAKIEMAGEKIAITTACIPNLLKASTKFLT